MLKTEPNWELANLPVSLISVVPQSGCAAVCSLIFYLSIFHQFNRRLNRMNHYLKTSPLRSPVFKTLSLPTKVTNYNWISSVNREIICLISSSLCLYRTIDCPRSMFLPYCTRLYKLFHSNDLIKEVTPYMFVYMFRMLLYNIWRFEEFRASASRVEANTKNW